MAPSVNDSSVFTPSPSPPGNHERHACAATSHQYTAVTRSVSAATDSPTDIDSPRHCTNAPVPATSAASSSGFGSAASSSASSSSASGSSSASSCTMVTVARMPPPAERPANSPSVDRAPMRSVTLSEQMALGGTCAV